MPEYLPCETRQRLVKFGKDGSKTRVERCAEPKAEPYGQDVTPADCSACPIRVEVTKLAIRSREYTPPQIADIAKVKESKRDTSPPAPWVSCEDRILATLHSCCGTTVDARVCDSADCHMRGGQVTPELCRACIFRRPG